MSKIEGGAYCCFLPFKDLEISYLTKSKTTYLFSVETKMQFFCLFKGKMCRTEVEPISVKNKFMIKIEVLTKFLHGFSLQNVNF